ncbi:hypothetical protein F8538_04155 [Edwardsiella ictaluri]|uniref:hypothetical protein n=1 Tax=Edwardsiella ictaluri TaxID=67780 RepID=UPI0009BD42BF|nr:hypothetical protein [Edwardsiella ictaluri]ARD40577.1 hypothetical protein B6E78_15375 [Edwardsiella ictaluri]QPW26125.1 hypothetical protein F8538_04155 [Edwardsiella ictaluri]
MGGSSPRRQSVLLRALCRHLLPLFPRLCVREKRLFQLRTHYEEKALLHQALAGISTALGTLSDRLPCPLSGGQPLAFVATQGDPTGTTTPRGWSATPLHPLIANGNHDARCVFRPPGCGAAAPFAAWLQHAVALPGIG